MPGKRVEVKKAPVEPLSKRELYARVCYHYPQYDLAAAQRLPARDITLLLRTASKIEANLLLNLTYIAAAPHSKKGTGVKKLASYFKGRLN